MQQEGKPKFLRHHSGQVKGVAFHPKDRFLFCSGAYDGRVNIYNARKEELTTSIHIPHPGIMKNINAVRFTSCGNRILAATTAKRLAVIDVNRGEQIAQYDNCAFNGRDRAPLATDPLNPHLAVCGCVSGKGFTAIDLRMATPADLILDLHTSIIRDIAYVPHSWPYAKQSSQSVLVSISCDGMCKITGIDGGQVHWFDVGHMTNSVATTPEDYCSSLETGFHNSLVIGGDYLSSYTPAEEGRGIQEELKKEKIDHPERDSHLDDGLPIWKLKYTSNGTFLYGAFDGGHIRRYRRHPNGHEYLGEMYSHKGEVHDMDISPYDEFLVTASKDRSVGLLCLGTPSHGCTGYTEIA